MDHTGINGMLPPNRGSRSGSDAGPPRGSHRTVTDMKCAPDKPTRGIKIIDVYEADECELVKADNVPLLPLSRIESCFTELSPNQQYFLSFKTGVRS